MPKMLSSGAKFVMSAGILLLWSHCVFADTQNDKDTMQFQMIAAELKLTTEDIQSISWHQGKAGGYFIDLVLSKQAGDTLTQITGRHLGQRMQLVIAGRVVSAATVQSTLGASMMIAVRTRAEAKAMVQRFGVKK